jgi:hypothetical protein
MDVTSELISRYADGCATADEAMAVEAAVAADPALRGELEDFRRVSDLFGHVEAEPVSKSLEQRLYALDATAPAKGFKLVGGPRPPRVSWQTRIAAVAALALLAVGLVKLTSRPDVLLRDVARMRVGADGTITDLRKLDVEVTVQAGDTLRVEEGERLSFRTEGGDRVTLLPGGALSVGDPRDGEIFELERGTTLCFVLRHEAPRIVRAGPYRIHVDREAHFGVRISDEHVRPAGAASGRTEVTVTVSHGAVEVSSNGDRETVSAYERGVFSPHGGTRTHAAEDPVFFELMRAFREHSLEYLPGYFSGEPGVAPIHQHWVGLPGGGCVLALSDGGAAAIGSSYLVLRARAAEPGPLRLTRLRPLGDRPGEAEAVTVVTPPVGRDWTTIAIPRADFDGPAAERGVRHVGEGMSRLVRLELKASASGTRVEVQRSLWADRPPVEVVK